jgi:Na+-driven multidrug efflux pump
MNTLMLLSTPDVSKATAPIVQLIKSFAGPIIGLVAALGIIYCILLGVKLAKAEEPQEREKAKGALKNAIIGFLLIFILIVLLVTLVPQMATWVGGQKGMSVNVPGFGQ